MTCVHDSPLSSSVFAEINKAEVRRIMVQRAEWLRNTNTKFLQVTSSAFFFLSQFIVKLDHPRVTPKINYILFWCIMILKKTKLTHIFLTCFFLFAVLNFLCFTTLWLIITENIVIDFPFHLNTTQSRKELTYTVNRCSAT